MPRTTRRAAPTVGSGWSGAAPARGTRPRHPPAVAAHRRRRHAGADPSVPHLSGLPDRAFPPDERLGLLPGSPLTPWLAEGLVRLGASLPFARAAELLAHATDVRVGAETVRRL